LFWRRRRFHHHFFDGLLAQLDNSSTHKGKPIEQILGRHRRCN
jgi:hypothetical protein